jgi:hypothetical protein
MAEREVTVRRPRSALKVPWGFGLLYGALTHVAGSVATLVLLLVDGALSADALGFGVAVLHGPRVLGPDAAAASTVPGVVYALVPVVALVSAGALLARGYVGVSDQQGVLAGATVGAGYVAVAVLAAVGSGAGVSGAAWTGAVAAAYAVVCGGAGGYLVAASR